SEQDHCGAGRRQVPRPGERGDSPGARYLPGPAQRGRRGVIQMSISAELLADAVNQTALAFAGITRAMAEMVERGMFGEWYIIGQVVTVGEVSWVNCHRLHNALYPLPDGWIIVGK